MSKYFRLFLGSSLLAGLVAAPALAQKPRPRIGPQVGVNFASVSGDDVDNTSSRTAWMFGVFAEIPLSNSFSLQPEANYTGKGPSFSDDGFEADLKINYIEIPVLLRLNFPMNSSSGMRTLPYQAGGSVGLRPHIYAGPSFGFKTSCNIHAEDESVDCEEGFGTDEQVKSTDFSLVFGGGLDISDFTLGVRYSLGLSNVVENTSGDEATHRIFTIYAGYGFRLR